MPGASRRRAAAKPIRSTRTRRRNSAKKTCASRSCCTGRDRAMRAVLASLLARWVLSFIGTALLAAFLGLFGPFVPALEDWVVRLVLVVLMLAAWAGTNLLLD